MTKEELHIQLRQSAQEVIDKMHLYMSAHPESELHRQGKMFGILLANDGLRTICLRAFSAMLDGCYEHEGFVPPVFSMNNEQLTMNILPVGHSKEESQRLQRLLFSQYRFTNTQGETANLLDIFANEKPIYSEQEWFGHQKSAFSIQPPSGAGDCCAPKLLQYALTHDMRPLALTEFWIGAAPKNELRREGCFYEPCAGRCMPILRWMVGPELLRQIIYTEEPKSFDIKGIDILYDDEWLMVINKPAGLLSVPGKADEPYVAGVLGKQAQPVHRLDQDTSGLLVLAKTPEVYKTLQAYFLRRDILKRYEAVVRGERLKDERVKGLEDEGMIDLPLLPDPFDRPRQMVNREHGKVAQTRYRVRERRTDGSCLIDFYPLTGRTHQLRVHAAHPEGLNAPIVGDRLYGVPAERLMLHAAEIRFLHPVTKEEMHFCIPSGF